MNNFEGGRGLDDLENIFYWEEKGALFKKILFEVVKASWQVTVSWSNKLIIVTFNVASLTETLSSLGNPALIVLPMLNKIYVFFIIISHVWLTIL